MPAPDLSLIHRLFWKSASYASCYVFLFCFRFFYFFPPWLMPAEWGQFLVRLRAGAILRRGLLPISHSILVSVPSPPNPG